MRTNSETSESRFLLVRENALLKEIKQRQHDLLVALTYECARLHKRLFLTNLTLGITLLGLVVVSFS